MRQTSDLQLSFKIQKTYIEIQKIDGTTLKTYKMVVFNFCKSDKDDKKRFF